jgi:transcriptional regulator with XRE-family HTH domain
MNSLHRMAPSPDPQPGLARAIAQLRKERGLTQEQLAELAQQHPTRISHLESGRVNPRWGVVRRIASALGVSMKDLAALAEELEAGD